jgi:hypothetical protein
LDAVLVLAVAVLVAPALGYWVITSRLSVTRKLIVIVVGMFLLTVLPLLVLLLGGVPT